MKRRRSVKNSAALTAILVMAIIIGGTSAWSPLSLFGSSTRTTMTSTFGEDVDEPDTQPERSRRRALFFSAAAMNIGLLGGQVAWAADAGGATVYKSGKTPLVPGGKPKDKSDVKGTRKDPDFLRSVADCRNQCLNSLGPDGLARSKEDCLSECQDICCKTYEQCTFDIVPRL